MTRATTRPSETIVDTPRRRLRLLALAVTGVLCATLLPWTATEPTAHAEGLSGSVVVHEDFTPTTGDGLRTPDVIATSENDLVVTWREDFQSGQYDVGTIRYATSHDGGASWSAPRTMAAKTATVGWVYCVMYKVGTTLYAFLGETEADSPNGAPVSPRMKRSLDGGETWDDIASTFPTTPENIVVAGRPLKYGSTYLLPYHAGGTVATLRSTDLVTWTSGAAAPDPNQVNPGEAQLYPDQDNPSVLRMTVRIAKDQNAYDLGAVYAHTTTSTNGGLTWTPLAEDPNIPNFSTKGYVTTDSAGRYLALYNSYGGRWRSTPRPDLYREILNYKVKLPGQPWGPGRFVADHPKVVTQRHSAGWDAYPMAYEYQPGRFFVVWEHDTTAIRFAKLDISDAFTGIADTWSSLGGWTTTPSGGTVTTANSRLRMTNGSGTVTSAARTHAPDEGFITTLVARLTDPTVLNPATGAGVNLGVTTTSGTRTMRIAIQPDGVYRKNDTGTGWTRVYARTDDGADHQYRVAVDNAGQADLYVDGIDVGARWTVPAAIGAKQTQLSVSGTSADPAGAEVDWLSVEENVRSTTWDSTSGWTRFGSAGTVEATGGDLHISSPTDGLNGLKTTIPDHCDFSVDFKATVTDYAALDVDSGKGTSLAIAVANGSRRLMLSLQSDGVYALVKNNGDPALIDLGHYRWKRVYAVANPGASGTWRVDTGSGGIARLYRNGAATNATWFLPDTDEPSVVQMWNSGRPSDTATASVDWLRVTCDIRSTH